MSNSHTLARKRKIRARAWRGKGGLHGERRGFPKRSGRASKNSLSRENRRKHERVSSHKSSLGQSAESWFHSKSGKSEMNKKLGAKGPLIRKQGKLSQINL